MIGPDGSYVLLAPTDADRAVRLWTQRRLPFETDQSAAQKLMVRAVGEAMRDLDLRPGEAIRGVFVSSETARTQPDAENITFYNWRTRTGQSAFAGPLTLRFERSFGEVPACPVAIDPQPRYHHVWQIDHDEDWLFWEPGNLLAEWVDICCDVVFGDDAGRHVWRAMAEQPAKCRTSGGKPFRDSFSAEVEVAVPSALAGSAVEAVKGCIDGAIAAFQQFPGGQAEQAEQIMSKHAGWKRWRRPASAEHLIELVCGSDRAPVFPGGPFNLNGLDPCDDRCVAGRVSLRIDDDLTGASVSGRLVAVSPAG